MFSFCFDGSEGLSIIGEVQVRSERAVIMRARQRLRQLWSEYGS
jgi:hypothetical protein